MQQGQSTIYRGAWRLLFALLLSGLCSTAVWAQFKASIQGTVADASGAVIAGAKVTLVNKETGRKSEATASSEGFYRFSSLAPGAYKLTAEREGFKKKELENITVSAEGVASVDVVMETGGVSETVTMSSEAAGAHEKV